MTDLAINSDVSETPNNLYLALIEKMHGPDAQAANAATPWARETLKRLTAVNAEGEHEFTLDDAVIAVCSVYKPVTAKGKATEKLGGLRLTTSGNAMAGRLNNCKYILTNIGKPGVKALVATFIAATTKAKRDSFGALFIAVNEAVREAAPKAVNAPKAGDDVPNDEQDSEGAEEAPSPDKASVIETIALFATWFNTMNPADLLAMTGDAEQAALLAMSDAMNAANDKALAMLEAQTAPTAIAA